VIQSSAYKSSNAKSAVDFNKITDYKTTVLNYREEDFIGSNASRAAIDIFWFLRLHWAVEAQYTLFPDRRWPLFNQWASEAIE
jgi:hypothetical protein